MFLANSCRPEKIFPEAVVGLAQTSVNSRQAAFEARIYPGASLPGPGAPGGIGVSSLPIRSACAGCPEARMALPGNWLLARPARRGFLTFGERSFGRSVH